VNNLIGFTTKPAQEHSRASPPISPNASPCHLHVNAEDPDAVVRIGRLARNIAPPSAATSLWTSSATRRTATVNGRSDHHAAAALRTHQESRAALEIYAERTGIDSTQIAEAVARNTRRNKAKARALKKSRTYGSCGVLGAVFAGR